MNKHIKLSGIALAAAKHLSHAGWRQYRYGAAEGPNCVMGAIYVAGGSPLSDETRASARAHEVANEIGEVIGSFDKSDNAAVMNDRSGTTAEDMVMALLLASEVLKEQGK